MSFLPEYFTSQQADLERVQLNKCLDQLTYALQTREWYRLPQYIRFLNNCLLLRIPFTAQQRQTIIEATWKFLQEPVLDSQLFVKMASLTAHIFKQAAKRNDKFTVPWSPLYFHMNELFSKRRNLSGPISESTRVRVLGELVRQARKFFPLSATTEIWKTLTPRLALHDTHIFRIQWLLTQLLPTHDPQAWTVWGHEGLAVWRWVDHSLGWSYNWFALYARLVRHQALLGYDQPPIDATALSVLFQQNIILTGLATGDTSLDSVTQSLPRDVASLLPHELDTALFSHIGQFMAYVLTDNEDRLILFERFVSQLATYFYPSNEGKWSNKFAAWLLSVTRRLVERIRVAEQHNGKGSLSTATLQRIVHLLLPLASAASYNKSYTFSKAGTTALKHLAYLSLKDTFTLQLNRFTFALETLTATHQLVPTLDALSLMMESLIRANDGQGDIEGIIPHLADFLLQTTPAIDSNDVPKTQHALKLYYAFLLHVPLFESESSISETILSDHNSSAMNMTILKERQIVSAVFHDWALEWLDRTFNFLYNKDRPPEEESWQERIFKMIFERAHTALFMQASPVLHSKLQQRLLNYIQSELCLNAKREFGYLCAACVAAQPSTSVSAFVTTLSSRIISSTTSQQQEAVTSGLFATTTTTKEEGQTTSLAESELVWRTHLLAKVCRYGGVHLLAHRTQLLTVLRIILHDSRRDVVRAGGKLLRNLLFSLTMNYPLETRSLPPTLWNSALTNPHTHLTLWGHYSESLDVQWHHPTTAELQWAREVVLAVSEYAMSVLRKVIETKVVGVGHEVWRALFLLRCVLRGAGVAFNDFQSELVQDEDTDKDPNSLHHREFTFASVSANVKGSVESESTQAWRENCARTLDTLAQTLLTLPSVPSVVFKQVALLIHTLLTHCGVSTRKVKCAQRRYKLFKEVFINQRSLHHRLTCRALRIEKAHLLHLRRLSLRNSLKFWHSLHSDLLNDLIVIYLHNPHSFKKLIPKIIDCLKCPGAANVAISQLCARLSDPVAGEETLLGAVSLLNERYLLQRIVKDWRHKHTFLRHLLRAHLHDIPHFQSKLYELFVHFCLVFSPSPLTLPLTPAVTYVPLSDAEMSTTQINLTRINERNLSHFIGIWQDVIEQNTTGTSHWRYEIMSAVVLLLLLCPLPSSFPTPLLVKTVEWILSQLSSPLPLLRLLSAKLLCVLLVLHRPRTNRSSVVQIPHRITSEMLLKDFASLPLWDAGYLGWNGPVLVTPPNNRVTTAPDTTNQRNILYEALRNYLINPKSLNTLLETLMNDHNYASPDEQSQQQVAKLMNQRLQSLSRLINVNLSFLFDEKEQTAQHDNIFQRLFPEREWHYYRMPLQRDAFSELYSTLWSEVTRAIGTDSMTLLTPHITTLMTNTSTRGARCVAAEILAGLTRSMTLLTTDTSTLASLSQLWHALLTSATLEDDKDLTYAIRYAAHHRDPRRLSFLYQLLIPPHLTNANVQTSSKLLRCATALLVEGGWRVVSAALSLTRAVVTHLTHPSVQLRQDIATALFVALDLLIQVPRDAHDRPSLLTPPSPSSLQNEIVEQILEQLTQAEKEGASSQANLRCKDTLVTLVNTTVTRNSDALTLFFPRLLPILFVATVETVEETRQKARRTLALVAQFTLPQHFLQNTNTSYLTTIEMLAHSSNWQIRKALLPFLQITVFNHTFSMSQTVLDKITEIVVNLLQDERVEVRDTARIALTSLCKAAPLNVNDLIVRFKGWIEQNDTLHRHAGVLGIRALIESAPYTIPTWLPQLLVYQAKLLHTPSKQPVLIRHTVTETLQEFWRTHRDDWELSFKQFFNKDQLDIIQQRTTPSYYA